MSRFVFVLLLLAAPAFAQTVEVVKPNGDTALYVPRPERIKIKHDSLWLVVHDTTRDSTHVIERITQPIILSVNLRDLHDTVYLPTKTSPSFGIFGEADFKGVALGPGIEVSLGSFELWIFMGAFYNGQTHLSYFTAGAGGFARF